SGQDGWWASSAFPKTWARPAARRCARALRPRCAGGPGRAARAPAGRPRRCPSPRGGATRHRSSCACRLLLTVSLDGGVEGVAGDAVLGGVVAQVRAVVPVLVDGGEDLAHPAHGGVLVLAVAACLGDELGGPCRIDVPVALAVGEGKGDVAQELLGAVLARRLPLLVGELLGPVAVVDDRRPVGVPVARRTGEVEEVEHVGDPAEGEAV